MRPEGVRHSNPQRDDHYILANGTAARWMPRETVYRPPREAYEFSQIIFRFSALCSKFRSIILSMMSLSASFPRMEPGTA